MNPGLASRRRAAVLLVLVCALCALIAPGARAEPSEAPFELLPESFHVVTSSPQAGAHADLTTSFDIAHTGAGRTINDLRTAIVEYPPGEVGNTNAVRTCSETQLIGGSVEIPACPIASQVGTISFQTRNAQSSSGALPPAHFTVPLFNMEVTSPGIAAEFGFKTISFTQVIQVRVRASDTGLTATTPDIARAEPFDVVATVWGVPAAHVHDSERALVCGEAFEVPAACHHAFGSGGPVEAGIQPLPYLSNPTSCVAHEARIAAYSWELPEEAFWSRAQTSMPESTECERVPFDPSVEVRPTTRAAESPSGLDVSLVVPQSWGDPNALASSDLKDATVALPVGYTINPSAGAGLGSCTVAQFEAESLSSAPGEGCPSESKIGTMTVETPLLSETLHGNVYVARPFENRFGSLLALYLVVKGPARGILVKLAGRITPNETTGQLVTTFDENPQVPFTRFTLELLQATTSPLVSPPVCGSYAAEGELTPWSAPSAPRQVVSPAFAIETGIGGGACPAGGVPPFHPQAITGTLNNRAGSYSPFYLRLVRQDGEQEITRFSTTMPPGLTGNLSGIPFCPDGAIQVARSQTGAQAEAEPACPAASQVGHSLTGAGVGSVLAQTPGRLYFAGPYHGAPFSLVSITSAKVGPFDLGTVVIRFALRINPVTAQVEVDATGSDPIPHIIKGIVVHVRDIRAYVDRPGFILNPTSCERLSIENTISGGGADPANPADQTAVATSSPFQAADCASLKFKPLFKATTSGKPSRADGASLTATLTMPGAVGTNTNIHEVKVKLPKQLPSRLTTLQKACLATVFQANPASCPAASVVGHATATTPLLPVPLTGPAYFVSHGGEAFPSLIIVLQGDGVTIDLTGATNISKKGITSSTFKAVPDQPVGSFTLTLPQGPYSALTAIGGLCNAKHLTMPTELVAQNGATINQQTRIAVTGCPRHKHTHRRTTRRRGKGARHRKH